MIVSLVMEFAQEWFREKYGWKWNECGTQFQSVPSYSAGHFFVSIDDAGVETGRDDTDALTEIVAINLGIWRRKEHFMQDQIGQLKLKDDLYLIGSKTLGKLEQQVKIDSSRSLGPGYGLHKNYVFMNALNDRFNLPSSEYGATFTEPFSYKGRGSMESQVLFGSNGAEQIWYGYRLRFAGLKRTQILHRSGYAVG